MSFNLPNQHFVVLDVETTGLEPRLGHEIIEIAAQKLQGRQVVDTFSHLVKPTKPITPDMTAIHGITNEMVEAEGVEPAVVFPALVQFLGSSIIVAQNAPFDIGFINAHLKQLDLPILNNQVLDTKTIAQRHLILASYSLQNLAKYLKVPQPSAHRALVDVETTREVFFKLIEKAQQKS